MNVSIVAWFHIDFEYGGPTLRHVPFAGYCIPHFDNATAKSIDVHSSLDFKLLSS